MDKISVIIPVYNSENELERCLESMINQTYPNIEILLVDDGSTDRSLEICKKYESMYSYIKVFSQPNRGQSSARNKGIKESSGEFIGFVDSDDCVHPMMYEYLKRILDEFNGDVSAVQINITNNMDDVNVIIDENEKIEVVEQNKLLEDYMYDGLNKSAGQYSAARKLFKKDLLKEIQFVEGYIFEDILFNYEVLEKAKRLIKSNNVMYFYFQDSNSTMRRRFTEKEMDLLYICDLLIQKAKEQNNSDLVELAKVKKARSYFSLLAKIAYFNTNIDKNSLRKIEKELIKGLRNNYFLLMKSPIPKNRKVIITAFTINFKISKEILRLIQKNNRK